MGQGRVVAPSEWANLSVPDIYFTKEYYEVSGLLERDYSRIILLEWLEEDGSVYLPLILRKIPGTHYLDASSAYGYGGPWMKGQPSIGAFRDFLDEWAKENSVVCTFIRFHPLLSNAEIFQNVMPVKRIGFTAAWDLGESRDLVATMSKDHRKTYRRALRSGVVARVTENPQRIEDFIKLYETSMDRLSASDFYRFSEIYWSQLRDSLGRNSILVEAIHQDKVIATVWCLYSENHLHYHLSGTSDEARKLGGAVVCRVAAAEWAQKAGIKLAHHGGGAGGANSSLLEWKRRFDEKNPLAQFSVGQIIHDDIIFSSLSHGVSEKGFFPPWRSPK